MIEMLIYSDRVLKFGLLFQGRLESMLLRGALEYIDCNEESLAFEVLCDHICEYDFRYK